MSPVLVPSSRIRSLALAAVLASSLASPAAMARLDSPTTARAEALGQRAVSLRSSPRAAAYAIRLHELRDEVDDLNLLAQPYAQLVGPGSHPLVRTLALQQYADLERARGHLSKAKAMLEPLGFLDTFYVTGSFDNEGKNGCGTDFGPEGASLDLKARYPAKGREVDWHKLTTAALDGYVDLSTLLRPNTEAVAYALTFLDAPAPTRALLSLGTSGAFRLWVNGQLVASENRYNLPRPDQARVAVQLGKGLNRVLLKVCQETGPLGFYLRAQRGELAALGAKAVLPESAPPLLRGVPAKPEALPTLTQLLEREQKKSPRDATVQGELATVLAHQRAFEDKERTDTVAGEKAAELAPKDVELQLLAARLQRDDANLRRKHVEAALELSPGSAEAAVTLARHQLGRDHPERALALLLPVIEKNPGFGAARLALSDTREALGEWVAAIDVAEKAVRDLPHLPLLVREAASMSRRLDRHEETVARLRTAIALRFDDTGSRRSLASILADLGRVSEAGEQLEQLLKLDPLDNSSRLRLAELYAANERSEDAERLFAEAKLLAPHEPEVHEREGRALLAAGKGKEAIDAFRRSLALRPQNPALKEVLLSLEGESQSADGQRFALDPRGLVAEADSFVGNDAVYLVDYTYVRVQPTGLSSRFQQLAIKVYTQRGVDALRSYPITYAPSRQEVRVLKARITKPDGSIVESYGESDRAMNEPWTGMYYDTRSKTLSFPALAPGDLLEVQFRLEDTAADNLLSDYWGDVDYIQTTSPKLRYRYFVEMPANRKLFWNQKTLPPGIQATRDAEKDGRVLYRFSAEKVPRVVPEPSMPGWAEVATPLHVSTYEKWEQVGRYYWGLVRDQLLPNDELKKTVEKVLKGVDRKNELAVVQAIYNFVVTNTRYVALEFGIHGFKPYRVDRVLARRFGDCKDKASLIHAMLKVAGIDSRLVLLRMRSLGSLSEEPASLAAFNHAIAYVPKYKLFLDGTAEFHNARELPSADRNANILIVEPEGVSTFGSTPETTADENVTSLSMDVSLKTDGSATAQGASTVTGQSAPEYRRAYQASATRKATFEQGLAQSFPGLSVKQMTITDPTQLDRDVSMTFQVAIPRFAEAGPGLLRFHPFGSAQAYTRVYTPLSERVHDLALSGPWKSTFRYSFELPAGFSVAELPPEAKEESPFGRASMACKSSGAKLTCEGEVAFTTARIKAADYAAFRTWLGKVDQAMSRKLTATASGAPPAPPTPASSSAPAAPTSPGQPAGRTLR